MSSFVITPKNCIHTHNGDFNHETEAKYDQNTHQRWVGLKQELNHFRYPLVQHSYKLATTHHLVINNDDIPSLVRLGIHQMVDEMVGKTSLAQFLSEPLVEKHNHSSSP